MAFNSGAKPALAAARERSACSWFHRACISKCVIWPKIEAASGSGIVSVEYPGADGTLFGDGGSGIWLGRVPLATL